MSDIKPIETIYNGYRFRSRLEARWAVFFDALGVKYEYEPEGFELPSGKRYLPDFRVQCHGFRGDCLPDPFDLWIEVKGKMTQEDADKIREFFVCGDGANKILVVSDIPNINTEWDLSDSDVFGSYRSMDGAGISPFNYETLDGDYFAAYPAAYHGNFYLWGDDSNYISSDPEERTLLRIAYNKARQARFEHGETPTI